MIYTDEAWEEEQMSNLGCESVSDLIQLVKGEKVSPYEIQIWFHAQEDGRYLAEPHVVIKHQHENLAYKQYNSITSYDPFHIQLMEYDDNGDGDVVAEDGTWEMIE